MYHTRALNCDFGLFNYINFCFGLNITILYLTTTFFLINTNKNVLYVHKNIFSCCHNISINMLYICRIFSLWRWCKNSSYIFFCIEYVHAYIHIYSYVYEYVHIYSYVHEYIHVYSYVHVYIHICSYVQEYIHIYSYTQTYICTLYVRAYIHIYSYTQTYICMFIHCMYVSAYTHVQPIPLGVTFANAVSKLKAQCSNGSFHWNVAKETFELWALSFRKWHPKWDWQYVLCRHSCACIYMYKNYADIYADMYVHVYTCIKTCI